MVFDVEITDLYGNVLTFTEDGEEQTQIKQYTNPWVQREINSDRSAGITLSLYHPAVENLIMVNDNGNRIAVLGRMVRMKYRGATQIWGLVTSARFSTDKATVEIGIQGPTYKLRHREVNFGDAIVGSDDDPVHSPSDHNTIKAVVEAAYNTPSQYAENIPDIGVKVNNISGPDAPDGFWADFQRGDCNWDIIEEISASLYGGEWDVVPHDPDEDELPFDTTLVPLV